MDVSLINLKIMDLDELLFIEREEYEYEQERKRHENQEK